MPKSSQLTLPKEFFNLQSFYSLSGCSIAVWLLCAVIANIDLDTGYINVGVYKLIALLFSQVLAFSMIFYTIKEHKTGHHILLAFVNVLLIFVTATGINTITNSNALASTKKVGFNIYHSNKNYAGFFDFFKNQVDWWGDSRTQAQVLELKHQNEELLIKNAALLTQLKTVVKVDTIAKTPLAPDNSMPVDKTGSIADTDLAIQKKLKDCNTALTKIETELNNSANLVTRLESTIEQKNKDVNGYLNEISRLKNELERFKLAVNGNDDLNINKLQQRVRELERKLTECKAGKDE